MPCHSLHIFCQKHRNFWMNDSDKWIVIYDSLPLFISIFHRVLENPICMRHFSEKLQWIRNIFAPEIIFLHFPLTHYRFIFTSLPFPRTRFHTLILRGKNTGQNSWSDNFPRMTARPGMREIRAQNFSLTLWLPIIFRSCTVILCVLIGELIP